MRPNGRPIKAQIRAMPVAQGGQGECAKRMLDRLNDEMASVYSALLVALPPDREEYEARSKLVAAQNAWLQYRDATCLFEGGISGGVTMWQSTRAVYCMGTVTQERTSKLKAYLACARQEVDACSTFSRLHPNNSFKPNPLRGSA